MKPDIQSLVHEHGITKILEGLIRLTDDYLAIEHEAYIKQLNVELKTTYKNYTERYDKDALE